MYTSNKTREYIAEMIKKEIDRLSKKERKQRKKFNELNNLAQDYCSICQELQEAINAKDQDAIDKLIPIGLKKEKLLKTTRYKQIEKAQNDWMETKEIMEGLQSELSYYNYYSYYNWQKGKHYEQEGVV